VVLDRGQDQIVDPGAGLSLDDSPGNSPAVNKSRDTHADEVTGVAGAPCVTDTAPMSVRKVLVADASRRLALLLAAVAAALFVVGLLALLGGQDLGSHVAGTVVVLLALALAAITLGLRRAAAVAGHAAAEAALDAAVAATVAHAEGERPCHKSCSPSGCATEDCAVKVLPRR
jgi:hypothetical protein